MMNEATPITTTTSKEDLLNDPKISAILKIIEPRDTGKEVKLYVARLIKEVFEVKNIDVSNIEEIRIRANNVDFKFYIKLIYKDNNGNLSIGYIPCNKPIKWCKDEKGKLVLHFRGYICPKKRKNFHRITKTNAQNSRYANKSTETSIGSSLYKKIS